MFEFSGHSPSHISMYCTESFTLLVSYYSAQGVSLSKHDNYHFCAHSHLGEPFAEAFLSVHFDALVCVQYKS